MKEEKNKKNKGKNKKKATSSGKKNCSPQTPKTKPPVKTKETPNKTEMSTADIDVKKSTTYVNVPPKKEYTKTQKKVTANATNLNTFNNISKKYKPEEEAKHEPITKDTSLIQVEKMLVIALIAIGLVGLFVSSFKIVAWHIDSKKTDKQIEKVTRQVNIYEITNEESTTIIEPATPIPEENPYWDYIKMKLIEVDFSALKETNSETKGWIQVPGTNINYPFVQGADNDFYLTHSFDKSANSAGWVFMDYRNNADFPDRNTILYAHGRIDKTMFGSLKNVLDNSWLSTPDNFVVKTSTETTNSLWQVFSVYKIPTTNDYIQVSFPTDTSFTTLMDQLIQRSIYDFQTEVVATDRIITLSTCYNDEEKVVLHAKLIKTVNK